MNDYRFINIDEEPTDEQLAQLMREVAEEAKERYEKAHAAYFAQLLKWHKRYEETGSHSNCRSEWFRQDIYHSCTRKKKS